MNFDALEASIGVTFLNKELLKAAFIHRSYLNEDRTVQSSNERLEFLGDAVLSFLTSSYLYRTYPEFPEGKLTNIRSSLVNTKSLSDIAKSLGLGELLFLSRGEQEGGGRTNPSLLADAFESLLGAIYLDQGPGVAEKFLATHLFAKTRDIIEKKAYLDYKSNLQELVQEKMRISPTYDVVRSEGPDHAKTFWIVARAGEKILGEGTGRSKQEAEQVAARQALEKGLP